jgi:hypothetical protein
LVIRGCRTGSKVVRSQTAHHQGRKPSGIRPTGGGSLGGASGSF